MKKYRVVAALTLSAVLCGCTKNETPASQATAPPVSYVGDLEMSNRDLRTIAMMAVRRTAGTAVVDPPPQVVSGAVRENYGLVVYQVGFSTGEYIFSKSRSQWKIIAGGELGFNWETLSRFGVPSVTGKYLISHQVPLER